MFSEGKQLIFLFQGKELSLQKSKKEQLMIAKPIAVKALENYSIFVRFDDGTQGVADLKHLAHKGVFQDWDKNNLFFHVYIDNSGAIAWNDDIDICPDSLYMRLKGLTFEQWKQQNQRSYATN